MPHREYPQADHGKCRSCGFLSKHARTAADAPAPRFFEVEHAERGSADSFNHYRLEFRGPIKTEPMCFLGKTNLMQTLQEQGGEKLVEAILADRQCDGWYPYMPGLSPGEHYEELTMQRLENDRRDFEMRLFEMSQKAQENSLAIAKDSKAIVSDLKVIAEKNDKFSRRVTFWIVLLAALQALGSILALPSVSWVQRLWHYLFG
jgi:hypothetical protein